LTDCERCKGEGSILLHRTWCPALDDGACECNTHVDVSCPGCDGGEARERGTGGEG